jgi:hypothetical protein
MEHTEHVAGRQEYAMNTKLIILPTFIRFFEVNVYENEKTVKSFYLQT